MSTVFSKQAQKNSKGEIFAPGKADISNAGTEEYFSRNDYMIFKLCSNYDGKVRGGIRKTWRYVAKDLSLEEAKKLLERKLK